MAGLNATQIANFNKAYQAFNAMAVIQKAQSELWNVLDQDVQAFDVNADAPWKTKGIDHVIANFYNLSEERGWPDVPTIRLWTARLLKTG